MLIKIDYNAILSNAYYFKRTCKTKLCAVVKNNAYGHGLLKTAKCLQEVADYFAVATLKDGVKISGLDIPVLVLMPLSFQETVEALQHGLCVTVDSFDTLEKVAAAAKSSAALVHLKIDSGMHRFGFNYEQLPNLCYVLSQNPNVVVKGVYTHMWSADIEDCSAQADYYDKCVCYLRQRLGDIEIKHLANTSTSLLGDRFYYDMVRIGLGLYGYGADCLNPAKIVTAKVVATRFVAKGETVGYGGAKVDSDMQLAVIDAGYASGLPRCLKGSSVIAKGCRCRIVASVCMSCAIIDVSSVNIGVGEAVYLLGNGANPSNDNVIVYELLCNLH